MQRTMQTLALVGLLLISTLSAQASQNYRLEWSEPSTSNYGTSTTPVSSTLTYNVGDETLILEAYSWINYKSFGSGQDFYNEFEYVRQEITGSGTIILTLPPFKSRPGFWQDAQFSASLYPADGYHPIRSTSYHMIVGQLHVPYASR